VAHRTLWEEGHTPGPAVVGGTAVVLLVAVLLTEVAGSPIGLFFDMVFVLCCLGAALMVRPRDFFTVGVLPPLALTATVLVLAVVNRAAVAQADDSVAQAMVSGLAHRAHALAIGYALTLIVLALRHVALQNQGRLRPPREAEPQPDQADRRHLV
jgi:hypothetical protein